MRSHTRTLITFFSVIIILSLVPIIFFESNQTGQKHAVVPVPIPSETRRDLQIIHQASVSGAVLCTREDPSICQKNQEGKVLEYSVGCNAASAASSVYICKKGRWTYVTWTPNGYCHFCKSKSSQK